MHRASDALVKGIKVMFLSSRSPTEFLNFIIDDFKKVEKDDLNYHWRPQHGSCPFCRFNFTVYSKMEELHEDTAYILLKVVVELF